MCERLRASGRHVLDCEHVRKAVDNNVLEHVSKRQILHITPKIRSAASNELRSWDVQFRECDDLRVIRVRKVA